MSYSDLIITYRDQITNNANILKVKMSEHYEIYTYIGGEGPFFYFVDNVMYEMHEGDILILRPGVLRGGFKKLKARYKRLYVRFSEEHLKDIGEICPAVKQVIANGSVVRLSLPEEAAKEYFALVEEIRSFHPKKDEYFKLISYSILLRQLVIISRFADSSQTNEARHELSENSRLVREVIEHIAQNWMKISSAADIADELHYSRNYLTSCFKQQMNIGIREYLLEKKLYESINMLNDGVSVTDCAYNCGFGDVSYFIRVFKKRYGMTPKKYSLGKHL